MTDQREIRTMQQFGEYRLLRNLGGGNLGKVYLAEHIRDGAKVVVKVFSVRSARSDDFLDDMRSLRVSHPAIIPIFDFGIALGDVPYLVMEYVASGSMRDRYQRGTRVPLPAVVQYIDQLASAIQYIHSHQIIHRDIKPENILLRSDANVVLSDLGLPRLFTQNAQAYRQGNVSPYIAPEQYLGNPSFASDQYALAVVAYEWISGVLPFRSDGSSAVSPLTALSVPLRSVMPGAPVALESSLARAFAKEPEQRFANVTEFAQSLRSAVFSSVASPAAVRSPDFSFSPGGVRPGQQPAAQEFVPRVFSAQVPPRPSPPEPVFAPGTFSSQAFVDKKPNTVSTPGSTTDDIFSQPKRRRLGTRAKLLLAAVVSVVAIVALLVGIFYYEPSPPGQVQWTFATHGNVVSSPMIVNGILYVGSNDGSIYAINVSSGQKLWEFSTAGSVASSPTIVDGTLYVGANDGFVYALNARTGKMKWSLATTGNIQSSPAVANGMVYFGSNDNYVYAVDARNGHMKWSYYTGLAVNSSPVVVNGIVYIGSDDDNLYALDAFTGKPKWLFLTGGGIDGSPLVANGVVYVGSGDDYLYAVDAVSGAKKWSFQTFGSVSSTPHLVNGTVYVGSDDGNLYAVNASSGQENWVFSTGASVSSSPVIANGMVYVGSDDGSLYAVDASSGQKRWSLATGAGVDSTPLVLNGIIYFGSNDKSLYAVSVPTAFFP